jgi:hypothetical protein
MVDRYAAWYIGTQCCRNATTRLPNNDTKCSFSSLVLLLSHVSLEGPFGAPLFCVPSMIDSLEVEVLYPA